MVSSPKLGMASRPVVGEVGTHRSWVEPDDIEKEETTRALSKARCVHFDIGDKLASNIEPSSLPRPPESLEGLCGSSQQDDADTEVDGRPSWHDVKLERRRMWAELRHLEGEWAEPSSDEEELDHEE